MKKILFASILLLCTQAYSQKLLKPSVITGAVYDYSLSDIYSFKSSYVSLNTFFPFKAGVHLEYPINDQFSFIAGYHFLYRYLEVNLYTADVGNIFDGTRFMSSEIPLFIKYTRKVKSAEHFRLFAELGASFDMILTSANTFGRYQNDIIGTLAITNGFIYTIDLPEFTFPVLHASFGFSTMIGKKSTIDVLVNYHMQMKEEVIHVLYDYFTDHLQDPIIESMEYRSRLSYFGLEIRYGLPWGLRIRK